MFALDALIFRKEDLIDEKPLTGRYRDSSRFAAEYLTMKYKQESVIILVQDNNKFKSLKKPYDEKVSGIFFAITTPEIEMLMIHHFGLYDRYIGSQTKKKRKPFIFLAETLKKKSAEIKHSDFIKETFTGEALKSAIELYSSKSPRKYNKRNEIELVDLLK